MIQPIEKQQSLIEEAMLNISMAVARAVIYRELSLDSSSIKLAVENILNDLPKADKGFVLHVHPQDESAVAPVLQRYSSGMTLKLDDKLSVGGCVLDCSTQFIDYTIEKRFQKTVQSMLSAAIQNVSEQSGHELPSSINALTDFPSDVLQEEVLQEDVLQEEVLQKEVLQKEALADTPEARSQASEKPKEVAEENDPDTDSDTTGEQDNAS